MNDQQIPVATPIAPSPPPSPAVAASSRATAALVLGILSLVCMGFLTGIPAIILGRMELAAIRAGQAPAAGEASARVGMILGIVGTVLSCLPILAAIAIVALGISLGSMSDVQRALSSV